MNKVKWLLLLFVFFTIINIHSVYALEIEESNLVSELSMHTIFSGSVSVPGEMKRIEMNLSFPQNSDTQKVTTTANLVYDNTGNQLLHIEKENPPNPFYYSAEAMVECKSFSVYSLPKSYTLTNYEKQFLEATENIQSNSYEIQKLAEKITKGCEDDFERIAKLAIWVNEHVEYDLECGDKNYDALWVLKNRRGVCSEYATLFTALARALGFPVRYVGGYAYGREGWEPHAYTEVFLGKWIPVDPLWLQVGYLDATHVKTSIGKDNQIADNIEIVGYGVKNIKWEKNPPEFKILRINYKERQKNYELFASGNKLNPGDEFLVVWRYVPEEYGVAELDLEPCIGKAIEVDDKKRKVFLEPEKEAIAVWKLRINKDLRHEYIYTCPLTLNSNLFEFRTLNITIDAARTFEKIGIKAEVASSEVEIGENQTVFVDVSVPTGMEGRVGVVYENIVKEIRVKGDTELAFSFHPRKLGKHIIYVYTSTGDVVEIPFIVVENKNIHIKIQAPHVLKINQAGKIRISIVNENKKPLEGLKLTITQDGEKTVRNLKILGYSSREIEGEIKFSKPGYKIMRITLEGEGIKSSKIYRIRAYTKPEVGLSLLQYDSKNKLAKFVVFSKNDKALNISIRINEKIKRINELEGEKTILFSNIDKISQARICYYDFGGEKYCKEVKIKGESLISKLHELIEKLVHTFYEYFLKKDL